MIHITRLDAQGQNKIGEAVGERWMATEYYLDKECNPMTVIEGGHRVGFDVTLSAPKPVSIANAMKIADLVEEWLAERRA